MDEDASRAPVNATATAAAAGDVTRDARAAAPKAADQSEVPMKKRKTRRGKSKRRNVHPYKNELKTNKSHKPEAPYNSNRFLIEDHGNLDEIDEELRQNDQVSTSTVTRTRDSSFSVDSEGEFYSTPDDEEEFLIKDFVDQYESLQAERLHAMTKNELIEEYLQLETRVESLTKRLLIKNAEKEFQKEIERLKIENESLRRENETLKAKGCSNGDDSADSETDSSSSCSSTASSVGSGDAAAAVPTESYPTQNGHLQSVEEVV